MALPPAEVLAHWLQQQLPRPQAVELAAICSVGGGCIHAAWRLELADGRNFFLKSNHLAALPLLEAEAEGLKALARWAQPPLKVPQPLALGVVADQALLLLPWLDLEADVSGSGAERWRAFGAALALLHRGSGQAGTEARAQARPRFGWSAPNFIGSAPQCNAWRADWGVFFAECRLAPQLQWAEQQGHGLEGAERLLEQLPSWLEHPVVPALVHGDLWSGNAGLLLGAGGALFDPAVYWGDREVDLAMARLFGGFPPAFFVGYEESWPLEEGAPGRIQLYNLYHLLNHANLFGGSYWSQAQGCIHQLLLGRAGN